MRANEHKVFVLWQRGKKATTRLKKKILIRIITQAKDFLFIVQLSFRFFLFFFYVYFSWKRLKLEWEKKKQQLKVMCVYCIVYMYEICIESSDCSKSNAIKWEMHLKIIKCQTIKSQGWYFLWISFFLRFFFLCVSFQTAIESNTENCFCWNDHQEWEGCDWNCNKANPCRVRLKEISQRNKRTNVNTHMQCNLHRCAAKRTSLF